MGSRRVAVGLVAAAGIAAAASIYLRAPATDPQPLYSETRTLMSTPVSIQVAGADAERARGGIEEAFRVFERVDAVMNEWRPDSPLSALNAAAGSGQWTSLPPDLCEVLGLATGGAARTQGLFDPTWAALRGLWDFGPESKGVPPSDEAIERACSLVSYRDLEVDPGPDGCRARLRRPGMQIGLGGIAKGWGVDRAVAVLRRHGLKNFQVQAGGDLYLAGTRLGRPWTVGVRDPRGEAGQIMASLDVTDAAFSTTGDYEHAFVFQGVRYHHIIDPRTCRPAPASRSVSIVAPSATDAEILGKAAFIEGGRAGVELVERAGAAAVIITAQGERLESSAVSGRVRWTALRP